MPGVRSAIMKAMSGGAKRKFERSDDIGLQPKYKRKRRKEKDTREPWERLPKGVRIAMGAAVGGGAAGFTGYTAYEAMRRRKK